MPALDSGWSRLVRIIDEDQQIRYGEPILSTNELDIGELALRGDLKVKVIKVGRHGPLSPDNVVTPTIKSVHRLLSPLTIDDVPEVKCIGLNYRTHRAVIEAGRKLPPYPSLFVKPSTAINDFGAPVVIPKCCQEGEADYEAELCVVIGSDCKDVSVEHALDYVAGYTCGNDVSARKWQRSPERAGGVPQWCFSKGFDTFAPLGPCLVSPELIPDPSKLDLKLTVNGETRQQSSVGDLVFDIPHLISFLSQGTTLRRGTVIMSGTPGGVGCAGPEEKWKPLRHGDQVAVTITSIGTLSNPIVYE